MNLEQQIEEHLVKVGRIDTVSVVESICYLGQLKQLMSQYQKENKGKFYVPLFCTDCKTKYATNQKGWGSFLWTII